MPTALVIGARNLGFAIIERLLADGWAVTGASRSEETLAKVRDAGADALEVDVTDQESVLAALRSVADRHGRIDLVVNAASPYGGGRSGPFGGGPLAEARPSGYDDWSAEPVRGAFGFLSASRPLPARAGRRGDRHPGHRRLGPPRHARPRAVGGRRVRRPRAHPGRRGRAARAPASRSRS